MRRWLVVVILVGLFFSLTLTLLAQSGSFTPSPHIYKIVVAGCEVGPAERVQSGFRVKDQVGIVTALHGVLGCKTIIAEPGGNGRSFHNLLIGKVDIRHDIAVLWSKELAAPPLAGLTTITETLTIDPKNTYQIIGYPFGLFRQKPTVDVKILERTALGNLLPDAAINDIDDRNSPAIDAAVFSIQAHLVPGHSGAPILNTQGQVVGIGNGGLDLGRVEMGWAIPWDGIALQVISTRVSQAVSWPDYRNLRALLRNDSDLLFAYSTPEPPTSTPTATFTSTPSVLASSTPTATVIFTSTPQPAATSLFSVTTIAMVQVTNVLWMDQYETTNAQYAECVTAKACTPPQQLASQTRLNYYHDPQYTNYPVTNITWQQAQQYCMFRGKRLPSRQEWIFAATGCNADDSTCLSKHPYPWGNSAVDCSKANFYNNGQYCAEGNDTAPIGQYSDGADRKKGASRSGIMDLAGNVWEWTSACAEANCEIVGGDWGSAITQRSVNLQNIFSVPANTPSGGGVRCIR